MQLEIYGHRPTKLGISQLASEVAGMKDESKGDRTWGNRKRSSSESSQPQGPHDCDRRALVLGRGYARAATTAEQCAVPVFGTLSPSWVRAWMRIGLVHVCYSSQGATNITVNNFTWMYCKIELLTWSNDRSDPSQFCRLPDVL